MTGDFTFLSGSVTVQILRNTNMVMHTKKSLLTTKTFLQESRYFQKITWNIITDDYKEIVYWSYISPLWQ